MQLIIEKALVVQGATTDLRACVDSNRATPTGTIDSGAPRDLTIKLAKTKRRERCTESKVRTI